MKFSRRSLLKGLVGAGALTTVSGPALAREAQKAGPDDVGMLYDSTLCIGCRACVTACRQANGFEAQRKLVDGAPYDVPTDLDCTTKNIIKLHTEDGKHAFMKMQCMHCVDPACVSVCMAGGLHKTDNGVVAYDPSVCVGCRYCQVACPYDVPKFEWLSATPEIVKCEMCNHLETGPACCTVCPRGAVVYGKLTDLLRTAHERITKDGDRYLDKVYGEFDGGGTHVLYLTAKDVPFDKLGLPVLPDHPLPQMSETVQHTIYKGFIAPAALLATLTGVQLYHRRKNKKAEQAAGEEASS